MKTDKLLKLFQQKRVMRSGGALPLPKAQKGVLVSSPPRCDVGYIWDSENQQCIPFSAAVRPFPKFDKEKFKQDALFGKPQIIQLKDDTLESKINESLGDPMGKAVSKAEEVVSEEEDPIDNYRHPLAGMYTAQGIMNLFPEWMQYTGIPQTAGFLGSTGLGIGHELQSNAITQPDKYPPGYTLWDVIREGGEDAFNNMVGAGVGITPFVSDKQKEDFLLNAAYNNYLPDGYGKGDMYFKRQGGSLPRAQDGFEQAVAKYIELSRKGPMFQKQMEDLSKQYPLLLTDPRVRFAQTVTPEKQENLKQNVAAKQTQLKNELQASMRGNTTTPASTTAVNNNAKTNANFQAKQFEQDKKDIEQYGSVERGRAIRASQPATESVIYQKEEDKHYNPEQEEYRDDTTLAPEGSTRATFQNALNYVNNAFDVIKPISGPGAKFAFDLFAGAPAQSAINISNTVMGDRPIRGDKDVVNFVWDVANVAPFIGATARGTRRFINAFDDAGKMAFGFSPKMGIVPKSFIPEGKPSFQSKIDWGKWNSEIPNNKALLDEYHAIEEATKANGTWMKNADGSAFQGTPEQFIQQNSKNFKNAYPNGFEKVYRGTSGDMNTEYLAEAYPKGRGIFTGDLETGYHYAGSKGKLYELYHPSSSNSYDIDVKGKSWREVPIENLPNISSEKTLMGKPVTSTDDIATWAENNNVDYVNMRNIFDGTDAKFSRVVNNKPGNYLKSAVGNNGMFDLNNPNIYKGLVPTGIFGAGMYEAQGMQEQRDGGSLPRAEDGLEYKVRPGDSLSKISRNTGVSLRRLIQENNIKNPDLIRTDQILKIPRVQSAQPSQGYQDWEALQKRINALNALQDNKDYSGDEQRITQYYSNRPDDTYLVIDKKRARMNLYKGSELLTSYEVGTGEHPGDAQTVTRIVDGKVDWSGGNKSTGAGIYTISRIDPKSHEYYNLPSFNLKNDRGIEVATTIHGTPIGRRNRFENNNIFDNRMSNGCINGKCYDLKDLYTKIDPGSKVYILPEDVGNSIQIVDGKPVLRVDPKNRPKYNTYVDKTGTSRKGQGINQTINTLQYKPIKAYIDKKSFQKDIYQTWDFNDDAEYENVTKPYISSLVENKKKIMEIAQIPSDVYNEIARMAFGVYGAESNYGDENTALTNLAKAAQKVDYGKTIGNLLTGTFKLETDDAVGGPDAKAKATTYGANEQNQSVGYTQLRWAQLNNDEKTALKKLGIVSNTDLLDPKKAAIATATILGIRYNQQLTTAQKKDLWNHLPSKWNRRSNYAERVKNNSKYLTFKQLDDKYEEGGELDKAQDGGNSFLSDLGTIGLDIIHHPFSFYSDPKFIADASAFWNNYFSDSDNQPANSQNVKDQEKQKIASRNNYYNWLKTQENSVKRGWDPKLKLWKPYPSPEAGTDTIGYGHKLTPEEVKSGIYAKGITEQQAFDLMDKDFTTHFNLANQRYNKRFKKKNLKFDQLPYNQQLLIGDYTYNVGPDFFEEDTIKYPKAFPKFLNAIVDYNQAKSDADRAKYRKIIAKEYVRRYKRSVPMLERNKGTMNLFLKDFGITSDMVDKSTYSKEQGGELLGMSQMNIPRSIFKEKSPMLKNIEKELLDTFLDV